MGDPRGGDNPFAWDRIELNLPGSGSYDASKPWIRKLRGKLASGLTQFIDDLRIWAASSESAWAASSRIAKTLAFLGLQDAARKQRDISQKPGAWAGAIISSQGTVTKSVMEERWCKTQHLIRNIGFTMGLQDQYTKDTEEDPLYTKLGTYKGPQEENEFYLHFKALESMVGFLIYVPLTYISMVPYLKGLHLSMNSWRPNRDEDGWKVSGPLMTKSLPQGKSPSFIQTVSRCKADVKVLTELTCHLHPPVVPVRPTCSEPTFLVGDASGKGFGASKWTQGDSFVRTTHGNWAARVTFDASSNYQEAVNLALKIRCMCSKGELPPGSELWVFTDNSTPESTFYQGESTSPHLH